MDVTVPCLSDALGVLDELATCDLGAAALTPSPHAPHPLLLVRLVVF